MPGPYVFLVKDWAVRDVALDQMCWERHIKRRRNWNDDRMLPLIRRTIEDPDAVHASDQHAQRAEIWRHFPDVKDGQPGYVKVIVEYNDPMSGDVRTAMVSKATTIDSKGAQLWVRP